jgi:hypothetical protein
MFADYDFWRLATVDGRLECHLGTCDYCLKRFHGVEETSALVIHALIEEVDFGRGWVVLREVAEFVDEVLVVLMILRPSQHARTVRSLAVFDEVDSAIPRAPRWLQQFWVCLQLVELFDHWAA